MKVFLSSTYADLRDHRKAVIEALERLGQQVERMEIFGARPEEPCNTCLTEVEECDLFVGIYAHRYGFVLDGSTIGITEAEFRHAIALGKPIFCFLIDQNHPWPPKLVEGEPGRAKLETFKSNIGAAVVRDTFTTPTDLAVKVVTSVGRYIAQSRELSTSFRSVRNSFAGITIAQTVAMTFVDLMRLLYVAFGKSARAANAVRYPEFVDVADQHLGELRSYAQRFASDFDADLHEQSVRVERRLSWALTRLRRGPDVDGSWPEYLQGMQQIAQRVHELCVAAAGEAYSRDLTRADTVVEEMLQLYQRHPASLSVDELFRLRLMMQSILLERSRNLGGATIETIRDDMDQQFGVPYFVIDHRLLQYLSGQV